MKSMRDESVAADDEGLAQHYDLIVEGTGLVEGIVACAAAKAGKSVLHIDPNEYYGSSSASFQLDGLLSHCDRIPSGLRHLREDTERSVEKSSSMRLSTNGSPLFSIIDFTIFSNVEGKAFVGDKRMVPQRCHPSMEGYVVRRDSNNNNSANENVSNTHPVFKGYAKDNGMDRSMAYHNSRRFNLDLNNRLLFSSGRSVDCLVHSGVGNYLEFKAIERLFYTLPSSSKKSKNGVDFYQVPCSKVEVFKDSLLNALEKRSLAKFLQFAVDWGRVNFDNADALTVNEKLLALGGALHRPQNKDINSGFSLKGFEDREFREFMTHCGLTKCLQDIVTHALCFHPYPPSPASDSRSDIDKGLNSSDRHHNGGSGRQLLTLQGMKLLYRHISSLGYYGATAFLTPMYGTGELPQAFCRMCAVWGGVYILGRGVSSVSVNMIPASATGAGAGAEERNVSASVQDEASTNKSSSTGTDTGEGENKDKSEGDKYEGEGEVEEGEEDPGIIAEQPNDSSSSLPPPTKKLLSPANLQITDSTGRSFTATSFLCSIDRAGVALAQLQLQLPPIRAAMVTRISVCAGNKLPLPADRSILIIPPAAAPSTSDPNSEQAAAGAVGGSNDRGASAEATNAGAYVLQLDSGSMVAPDGAFLLYTVSEVPFDNTHIAVEGEGKEEAGSSIISSDPQLQETHQRDAWQAFVEHEKADFVNNTENIIVMLQHKDQAAAAVKPTSDSSASSPSSSVYLLNDSNASFRELFHFVTVRPLFYQHSLDASSHSSDSSSNTSTTRADDADDEDTSLFRFESDPHIAFTCDRSSHPSLDDYVDQAREIFARLFPGEEFFPAPSEEGGNQESSSGNTASDDLDGESLMLQQTIRTFDQPPPQQPQHEDQEASPPEATYTTKPLEEKEEAQV